MKKLIERFSGLVKSSLSGFDRIVFKGLILPLMSAGEVLRFCRTHGILNKDYKLWMMTQTKGIIEHADQYAKDNCGHGIIHGVPERRHWPMNGSSRVRSPAD